MHSCDVLIVGGGPAGSSCARRLVDAGIDVLLIDRARFPRDKVCAGWITPAVVRALQLDLAEYAKGRTLQPFTGFRVGILGREPRLTDFGEPVSYGIRRCEFDTYLLRRSGVPTEEGEGVVSLRREDDRWIVNDRISARMIVGAGGHFCPIARECNPQPAGTSTIAAQEIELPMDDVAAARCTVRATAPELYFWNDLAGYAWCVRKDRVLNIGAGRLTPYSLNDGIREFRAILERRNGGIPKPAISARWKGHAYLLNRLSHRRIAAPRALLVGDAAGLALAPSGEGILAAVESGLMAADVIVSARHDYSQTRLAPYALAVEQRFGKRAQSLTAVPAWLAGTAARALTGLPWLTRRVLLEDGFLHVRRPALKVA